MKFKQITASKFIGTDGYTLRKGRDSNFALYKDGQRTKWGSYFRTVRSAEIFLDQHDYISASYEYVPMSAADVKAIEDMYGYKSIIHSPSGELYDEYAVDNHYSIAAERLHESNRVPSFVIKLFKDGVLVDRFSDAEDLILTLDELLHNKVVASVICRGTDLRYIFAKADRRSARDITRNLVRVKSSNVWAYGVEIRDNKAKTGDVYVQFKGKNGGPGDVYVYFDVPITLWRKFISAPSAGHFVWKYLRNNFMYSKLTGDKRGRLKNAINR